MRETFGNETIPHVTPIMTDTVSRCLRNRVGCCKALPVSNGTTTISSRYSRNAAASASLLVPRLAPIICSDNTGR